MMGPCLCGHAPEEHAAGADRLIEPACRGLVTYDGKEELCPCVHYEEDRDG
jgi:hypothetical protein